MKKVTLVCGDRSQDFEPAHAQNILQITVYMQKVSNIGPGWELPEDSPYEFVNNGLIKRSNKRDSKESPTSKGDTKGSKPSGEAEIS